MTRIEIRNKIIPIFSGVMFIELEEINEDQPLWSQQGIDELDILEFLSVIDEVFGTNLFKDESIDFYSLTMEYLIYRIEHEVNN